MKSPPRSEVAAAAFIVALAKGSPPKKARVSAAVSKTSAGKISTATEKRLAAVMAEATKDVSEFLEIVLQNNPTKTVSEILQRPDVQQALRAHEAALEPSKAIVQEAWDKSVADAAKKARSEIELLHRKWEGYDEDRAVLDALLKDLDSNSKAQRGRLIKAMRAQHRKDARPIPTVVNSHRLRNQYTGQHAVWSSQREVRNSAFQRAGLNRRWIAAFGPNMCSHCRRLHNLVAGPDEQFPHHFDGLRPLKVYKGVLWGPPRHPNCECMLVPTTAKSTVSALLV